MIDISFGEKAWEEYCCWQLQDKRTLKKINQLLNDIRRNACSGIGKPEALKNAFSGCWSRRIDDKNRIIYKVEDNQIKIIRCKGHYKD